jgi:hypothetical protein
MADLDQANPFVGTELKWWVRHMVSSYEIDALRLDTAPYVPLYLSEWAAAAGIEVLGEVTASNLTFHASYTRDPTSGTPVLGACAAAVIAPTFPEPTFLEHLPIALSARQPTALSSCQPTALTPAHRVGWSCASRVR